MRLHVTTTVVFSIVLGTAGARADGDEPSPAEPSPPPTVAPVEPPPPAAPSETKSEEPIKESGVEGALRIGGGVPIGKLDALAKPISDSVPATIPAWLDLGYRVNRHVYVGGFFQYAFLVPSNCPAGASCSGSDIKLGLDVQLHPSPGSIDPWFGIGAGWEIVSLNASEGGTSATGTGSGLEIANLVTGLDFELSDKLRIGPFASLSLGMTLSESLSAEGGGQTQSASSGDFDKTVHAWVWGGFHVAFDP